MTMRQITTTSHQLEMAGPRNIAFRPATEEFLRPAAKLAFQGSFEAAIDAAEEAYVARNGDMHGIAFRVRTTTETLSGIGSVESLLSGRDAPD